MQMFRASFYKDVSNSQGHVFRCLQREFEFGAESVAIALKYAEDRLAASEIDVDAVEVVPIIDQPASSNDRYSHALALI